MAIKRIKGMDPLDLTDMQDMLLSAYAAFTIMAEDARRDDRAEWFIKDCETKAKRCHEVWQRANDYFV